MMAKSEQLAILENDGVEGWNRWRSDNPGELVDLSGARFFEANLSGINLSGGMLRSIRLTRCDLTGANLAGAYLINALLWESTFTAANLRGAYLHDANLRGAKLERVDLSFASLDGANLSEADFTNGIAYRANLERVTLVGTILTGASVTQCRVYGVSAWGLDLSGIGDQSGLVVTPIPQPKVTVDDLEVAQFIYLMLHNKKLRNVIDTITGKGVLILGRFTDERKSVLDAIKERLQDFELVPMVFDWDKPTKRDLTETIQLLANLSRFIVADVSDAKSIPQELSHIVPFLPSVPVRPIIVESQFEYAMFEHWDGYNTMLPVFRYEDKDHLIGNIEEALLAPVRQWEAGYDKTRSLEGEIEALRAENERLKQKAGENG